MALRMCNPTRRGKSGIYYIRKRVPDHLRPLVGTEIKRTLHTADPAEARKRAPEVSAEIANTLERAQLSLNLRSTDLDALTGEYYRKRLTELESKARREGWDSYAFEAVEYTHGERIESLAGAAVSTEEEYEEVRTRLAAAWGQKAVTPLLDKHGLTPSPIFLQRLGEAVYRAESVALAAAEAEVLGHPEPEKPKYTDLHFQPRYTLSELWREYAAHYRGHRSARSLDYWETCVEHCAKFMQGKPATEITREDLVRYTDTLRAGQSPSGKPLGAKSINDSYLSAIQSLYTWAVDRGMVPQNPARKMKVRAAVGEGKNVRGYTREEARKILLAARERPQSYQRWAPWLCAFTGARISEILAAERADIQTTGGIPYLAIRMDDEKSGKGKLKTDASVRSVPLHPALVAEGFLEYVAGLPKAERWLFPGDWKDKYGSRTKTPANRLRDWINSLTSADLRKDLNPNHSFRHWLSSECRRARIDPDHQRVITGHTIKDVHGRYGPADVPILYEAICRISSPVVGGALE